MQLRLQGGLSFTEFSYMLLQSADFLHLYRVHGVELQAGGADQWGNITAGIELIRRTSGEGAEPAHGLSYPLLLSPSGAKFGKSESGDSVWLDPPRTSPYRFYQYWVDADDRDVGAVPAVVHAPRARADRGARGGDVEPPRGPRRRSARSRRTSRSACTAPTRPRWSSA